MACPITIKFAAAAIASLYQVYIDGNLVAEPVTNEAQVERCLDDGASHIIEVYALILPTEPGETARRSMPAMNQGTLAELSVVRGTPAPTPSASVSPIPTETPTSSATATPTATPTTPPLICCQDVSCLADLNRSGTVDFLDFGKLIASFGDCNDGTKEVECD